ncbi:MAG: hypothetical protein AB7Q42_07090 [Acidimicrobiia bacterium]
MKKRFASAGLVAGLLAGGGAGVALGVTSISSATTSPSVSAVDDTATTDPATTDSAATATERPDRGAWVQDALQSLIDDGTITQAQADAVTAALEAARPEGGPGGRGMGHGGPGGEWGGRHGRGLEAAATALGMTADELRTALQDGQTIAEVAASKDVDVQTVIDAMVADVKAHLDEEVAAGEHTQEEADAKLAEATQRITERVNGTQGS